MKLEQYSRDELDRILRILQHAFSQVYLIDPDREEILQLGDDGMILPTGSYLREVEAFDMNHCESIPVRLSIENGKQYSALLCYSSLLNQEAAGEEAEYFLYHDTLTGLLNQEGVCRRIREALEQNPDRPLVLVAANLWNYRILTDLFGRAKGTEVIQKIADLLREQCGEGTIYGRIRDDHFVVCMPAERFSEEVLEGAARQIRAIPISSSYQLYMHMGVYVVSDVHMPVQHMIDRATLAIHNIHKEDDHFIAYFTDSMQEKLQLEEQILDEFKQNLEEGRFQIYLQARVNNNARIEGAEALVRWVLPDGTIKEPAEFLGILEKTDFITHMDYYVWEQSVKLLHKWDGSRFGHLFLSINVSPRDFYYIDVEQVLTDLLEKYQVPKERLRIEVTVNALATDLSRQMFYINRLKAAGFTVEIDDFTKNMSAVGVLMDTKADTLKFNLRYFRDAMDNSRSRQMTLSFIEMSKKLGMKVAIEGIETEKQFEEAKLLGSDTLQGYYFSKPIPVEQFEANL